jgi:glucose/mannose transport system permease protein
MTAGITAMSRAETATPVFAEKKARRRTRKALGPKLAVFSFLLMAAAFFCVPLYVIVVTAFKSMDEIRLGNIFSLPQVWTVEGWHYAMFEACSGTVCSGLSMGFFNSLYILAPSLVLSIGIAVVTGYAMAVWKVKWANGLLFTMFVCAFVPFQVIMFPLIKIASTLGVFGSVWGVALVHSALALPILTLIFTNYFRGLPADLMSAAMIDSGSFWVILREVILPMSGNILIVVLILQITGIWNDFLVGATFGGATGQPMTVMLNNMSSTTTSGAIYNVIMAGALLTAAPPLFIYFVLGKFFVQGITAGALKG